MHGAAGANEVRRRRISSSALVRFGGADRAGVPFLALIVVDRDEVGSPPSVRRTSCANEVAVDRVARARQLCQLSSEKGSVIAAGIGDARHRHLEAEFGGHRGRWR